MSRAFVQGSDYRAFFDRLADLASAAILPHFRAAPAVDDKGTGDFDPVTVADRNAEAAIRAEIARTFPDHGVIGEEFGPEREDAERVFIVDPIDGTRSFIAGLPIWGVLIGLLVEGRPALGMMAQPFTGERYFGDGSGASYSGPGGERPLRVRSCAALGEAVLFTTTPAMFERAEREAYDRVENAVRLARYGADCYAYCMVAAGSVDAVVEARLQPYDILPLIPIIEGAGGVVTDWEGRSAPAGGNVVASGDRRLHDRILAELAG